MVKVDVCLEHWVISAGYNSGARQVSKLYQMMPDGYNFRNSYIRKSFFLSVLIRAVTSHLYLTLSSSNNPQISQKLNLI